MIAKIENEKIQVGNYSEFLLLLNRVYEAISSYGYKTTDYVTYSENKWVNIATEDMSNVVKKVLSEWTYTAQAEFRTISSVLNVAFTDDMSRVIAILNNFLPRMTEYSQSEMENYQFLKKSSTETVVEPSDLLDMLAKEDTAYIRRLITSSVGISSYYSGLKNLPREVVAEMEEISLSSLTQFNKYEEEIALRSLVSIGSDSQRPANFETKVPRYDFVKKNIPLLTTLSNFDRRNGDNMALFITNIPTVMAWVIGGKNAASMGSFSMDSCLDLFHNATMINRIMAMIADRAAQLRFRLSHGYPEYRELLKLLRDTDSLFVWTVEGFLFRLSEVLPEVIRTIDPNEKHRLVKWLMISGVLNKYAEHKDLYIKRN